MRRRIRSTSLSSSPAIPKKGRVVARFYFRDDLINEAKVDLASAPSESDDDDLFVGFTLKPKEAFPVSDQYRVEASLDDKPVGVFSYRIDPPEGAIAARLDHVALVRKLPADSTDGRDVSVFAFDESVVLAGVADVGKQGWLQAEWYLNGRCDNSATQVLTYQDNRKESSFRFTYRPDSGWKAGRHEVVLLINGREAARKVFSVRMPGEAGSPADAGAVLVKRAALHRDNGHGRPADPVIDAFTTNDRILHFVCDLENLITGANGQITWTLVRADGGLKDIVMARAPLSATATNHLAGKFTASRELPKGRYNVEITSQGKKLVSKDFEVTQAGPSAHR